MFYFLPTLLKIVKEGHFCTISKKDYLALKKRISFQKGRARKKKYCLKAIHYLDFMIILDKN